MITFGGVFSVLPTPFDASGDFDPASLQRVIDLFLAGGVNGFTALGVTGEVARLTEREREAVLDTVVTYTNGRVPVVAGTTTEGLRTCIEYTKRAKAAGASAAMISPPRAPKLNSDAVARHFAEVASAVDIPIIVQDYPPISGFAMEPALLARIARDVPSARTIKLEDPPTPLKTTRILAAAEGVEVRIFGGLGGVFLLEELLAGAAGAMTGFAFPEILVEIVALFRAGRIDEAADAFYRSVALMRFEFQEGIGMAIRKEVLRRRGALAHAGIRPPGGVLDKTTLAALDRVMSWVEATRAHGSRTQVQGGDGRRRQQGPGLRRGARARARGRAGVDGVARRREGGERGRRAARRDRRACVRHGGRPELGRGDRGVARRDHRALRRRRSPVRQHRRTAGRPGAELRRRGVAGRASSCW